VIVRFHLSRIDGCRHQLDREELGQRVAAELQELLAREPLPRPPDPGAVIRLDGARVHVGSTATAASLAHAIARRLYAALHTATGSSECR
jgi:hypothetical protein